MRFFAIASVLFTAAVSVVASPVVERSNPPSAAAVLATLESTISPYVEGLLYATPENATQAILSPLLTDITEAVNEAITGLNALVGYPVDVILLSADGTVILTVAELAQIVANVVILIFQAIAVILPLVTGTVYGVIFGLSVTLGQAVIDLISILVTLLSTIAVPLALLLLPIVVILTTLGLLPALNKILGGLL